MLLDSRFQIPDSRSPAFEDDERDDGSRVAAKGALAGRAVAIDKEVGVERERVLDPEPLHQRERHAVTEAEVLV
jgi:hypothetical protein